MKNIIIFPQANSTFYPIGTVVSYADCANPMQKAVVVDDEGKCVFMEDLHTSQVKPHYVEGPGGWELREEKLTPEQAAGYLARAIDLQNERREQKNRAMIERQEFIEKGKQLVIAAYGAEPVAFMVAELRQDESDSMSDYFGSTCKKRVVLAISKTKRDSFKEMRQAAALYSETADLATAPESAEHREKYSMGGGYYLKNGYRHSSGWQVSKNAYSFGDIYEAIGRGYHTLKLDKGEAKKSESVKLEGDISIEKHFHTKKERDFFIVILPRVSSVEYARLLNLARSNGGWYSRAWQQTPGGFAFWDEEKARIFVENI